VATNWSPVLFTFRTLALLFILLTLGHIPYYSVNNYYTIY